MGKDLVLGLGRSGWATVNWLVSQGRSVIAVDDRPEPAPGEVPAPHPPGVVLHWGGASPDQVAGCDRLVAAPGVPEKHPLIQEARRLGIEVIGDIELFVRTVRRPIIAITGTNGKSSVTMLTTDMLHRSGLRVRSGANLGTPVLELAAEPLADFYVFELSSFQLERTHSLCARAAVVLNLSQDHLDRHASFDSYVQAKARIYRGCKTWVANRDDPLVMAMPELGRSDYTFGWSPPGSDQAFGIRATGSGPVLARGDQSILPLAEVPGTSRMSVLNALAALALTADLGLDSEAVREAIRSFRGLPHRLEFVGIHHKVRFIDDSKATNVGSAVAAIESFDDPVILIAGGVGKGQDFKPWAEAVARKVRSVFLIGESAGSMAAVLKGRCPVERVCDLEEAVQRAFHAAQAGDLVLLAPACASFDQFHDYAERGRVFQQAVRKLDHG
ncbi:UDP-N-acetylmuramoylalanine--D-glutamate ligase [mine drainage metagenome]|uniref:UDP-N-acetylmuramoylalanine--D-glutamate ligase n=1 Tax=mine drainage metagenome TaxID=410659 RepID=T0ZCK6_9ZZZZ